MTKPWAMRGAPSRPMPDPRPMADVQIPLIHIGSFCFNFLSMVAIDFGDYKATVNDEELDPARAITLHLAHEVEYTFEAEDADKFWHWYLTITGQAKVAI